jgi:hypothetical protein
MMIIFVQLALRDLSYYQQNNRLFHLYDPLPAVKAAERISLGVLLPEISQVGPPPTSELRRDATGPNANDGLIWGISTYPCYEPIFGYRHELFPAHQLEVGPVNSAIDKHFNLVDPRCYLSSDSRACVAGSLFRSDQQFDVATFTSHRPLPWQSSSQSYAELGTKLTSTLSALMLLFVAIEGAVRRDRKSV